MFCKWKNEPSGDLWEELEKENGGKQGMTIYEIFFKDGSSYTLAASKYEFVFGYDVVRFEERSRPIAYFRMAEIRGFVAKGKPEDATN